MLKLKEVIEAFEMIGPDQSWINIKTGEVYNRFVFDADEMFADDVDELLNNDDIYGLPSQYELNEYKDMVNFVETIQNDSVKNKLYKSLTVKGAFRRFKNEIIYQGVREKWFEYRSNCLKEKAIDWLEYHNIEYEE